MSYNNKWLLLIFGILFVMAGLNTLDRDTLIRMISQQNDRIKKIEAYLAGVEIPKLRIADVSADKITTGVLTIKDGTSAAKVSVRDGFNNEIVVLDSSGIAVNNGDITVKNASGETVFDTAGLVSTTNFETDSKVVSTEYRLIHGAGYSQLTAFNIDVTNDRAVNYLVILQLSVITPATTDKLVGYITVDGTIISETEFFVYSVSSESKTFIGLAQVASGTHAIGVKAANVGSTDNVYINGGGTLSSIITLKLGT